MYHAAHVDPEMSHAFEQTIFWRYTSEVQMKDLTNRAPAVIDLERPRVHHTPRALAHADGTREGRAPTSARVSPRIARKGHGSPRLRHGETIPKLRQHSVNLEYHVPSQRHQGRQVLRAI